MSDDLACKLYTSSIARDRASLLGDLSSAVTTLARVTSNVESGQRAAGDLRMLMQSLVDVLQRVAALDAQVEMLAVFSAGRDEESRDV